MGNDEKFDPAGVGKNIFPRFFISKNHLIRANVEAHIKDENKKNISEGFFPGSRVTRDRNSKGSRT